jgi:hypothetical protein
VSIAPSPQFERRRPNAAAVLRLASMRTGRPRRPVASPITHSPSSSGSISRQPLVRKRHVQAALQRACAAESHRSGAGLGRSWGSRVLGYARAGRATTQVEPITAATVGPVRVDIPIQPSRWVGRCRRERLRSPGSTSCLFGRVHGLRRHDAGLGYPCRRLTSWWCRVQMRKERERRGHLILVAGSRGSSIRLAHVRNIASPPVKR